MRGQISAEMVILLVIIIAVVAIVASNLFSGTKTASTAFKNKVESVAGNINSTCFTDVDCGEGSSCVDGKCTS
ncbi:MAG: class III signal peptide-containing protein [Methanobacteriota archaeon]|nr:MAG: class III signal peptide-containing protein [Euryarchaeota archaeon]